MNGFADVLKRLREEAGLTQKELADRAGLSQRTVCHWEQGLRDPGWQGVQKLAKALGVNCMAFQTETDAEETKKRPKQKRLGRPKKK